MEHARKRDDAPSASSRVQGAEGGRPGKRPTHGQHKAGRRAARRIRDAARNMLLPSRANARIVRCPANKRDFR